MDGSYIPLNNSFITPTPIGFYNVQNNISPHGSANYQQLFQPSMTSSQNSNLQQQLQQIAQQQQQQQVQQGTQAVVTKKCSKCFKLFYAADFYQPTCTYHTDNFHKMEDRWLCCSRKGKEAPPCFNAYHIEDETTTQILQSMTVPKPEIIQQNNPILQGGNYGYIGAEKILYESILKKQGKTLGRWQRRKFRLTQSTLINYYDETDMKVHRVFQLADISINYKRIQIEGEYRLCMVINDGLRNHLLFSPVANQTEAWINALITQKKILLQSRSNQLLQSNTPQYPPFPISGSPPQYSTTSYLQPSSTSINNLYPGTIQSSQAPPTQVISYVYVQQQPPIYGQQQQQQPQQQTLGNSMDWSTTPGNDNQQQNQTTESNGIKWVQHHVSTSDTLAGLAIRYNTSIDVIKRINLIKSNQCITHQTLLVPVSTVNPYTPPPPQPMSEEERKRKLIQLFAVSENISKEEARSYLSNNDWDITKAIKELKDDLDWEQYHPFKSK
ncbi:hypothetical protein DLAC_02373 [Tieghemostelium lacteum]|uniref:PH domain-containing protein n=1 Tax=Tieghemostelium lacteum TaxID=361077 RepID=A0A152A4U2_TIELA|nr:hypothetical protein DLAC_02373 [Tieghemostelium lacteum]|eukprot:KYR01253.1 hypothetical protein DLAC_02373 [Tieghemostelium lacteum]